MDLTLLQSIVKTEIDDAVTFLEEEIGPRRAQALRYYRGDRLGNEEEGRSKVISRVLREAVGDTVPSLMRVFFGGQRAVEFVPTGPEDVAAAEQASDFINHVVLVDNPGVRIFHDVFKDSLYQVCGIVKYWKTDKIEVSYHDFTEKSQAEIGYITSEPGVEVTKLEQVGEDSYDRQVKRVHKTPRFRIQDVPGEEFLIDRAAIDIDTARFVAHRALLPFHELVAMGYDPELLESHIHHSARFEDSQATYTRYEDQGGYWRDDSKNPDERRILYTESWIRVDADEDGLSELRKFCSLGENHEIVNGDGLGEPATERPFVAFTPDPEPHLFFGSDLHDQTSDMQEIKSNVLRRILDSLSDAIHSRTVMLEGEADYETVANTEVGAIVIEYKPGAVRELVKPFVGKEAFPMLEYLDGEVDKRIGNHNMALRADTLQSTTKDAVNAQATAAEARKELIATLYAEGMKRLYSGLLRLSIRHMDKPRMVRMRGQFVEVDPKSWNANMDTTANVGLGHGSEQHKIQTLMETLAAQKEALQTMGPSNPLVGFGHVRNTLSKLLELQGFKDSTQFFKALGLDYEPPPQEPQPSDAEILAGVEREKVGAQTMEAGAKLELERDKALADAWLKAKEIEAKYPGVKIDMNDLHTVISTDRFSESDA